MLPQMCGQILSGITIQNATREKQEQIEEQVKEQNQASPYVSRSLSVPNTLSTSSKQVEIEESTDYSIP
jgi:hypothetical protein